MPLLGSHLSIAGGYYKAVDKAALLRMQTVQIFTKNNNQWAAKPLVDADIKLFRDAVERTKLQKMCAHNSYLINLASPDDVLWDKSLQAMVVEVERAEALGLDGVVMHPGSFVTSTEAEGLKRIAKAINLVHKRTRGVRCQMWLETTAGQGSNLGHRFEHLQTLLQTVRAPELLGICVDTCHIFAAGYPLQTAEEYAATMGEFDDKVGIQRIRGWHLNDSKKPLGSRVDRHEHIGRGCLGLEPFRHLLNDPRFAEIPMYLETEKGEEEGEDLDAINLRVLKGLIRPARKR